MGKRVVVTGAFSYIGAAITQELIRRGYLVHTLTNRRVPREESPISSAPLLFDVEHLSRELDRADAFVNTYWIRSPYAGQTFATAVANSQILIEAAVRAGVRRFVHVSVSNASPMTNLGYYRGKAEVEEMVRRCGLAYGIVRPTLVVGPADVLTNNIAWFLRCFPAFLLPGGGTYRLQPVTLNDTGRVVADVMEDSENREVDAAGPEVFSFRDYVCLIADACKVRRWILNAPTWMTMLALQLIELTLRDIVLTREELCGLEQELLVSQAPPLGHESVGAWLRLHGDQLGLQYVNDLKRHFGRGRMDRVLIPDLSGELRWSEFPGHTT